MRLSTGHGTHLSQVVIGSSWGLSTSPPLTACPLLLFSRVTSSTIELQALLTHAPISPDIMCVWEQIFPEAKNMSKPTLNVCLHRLHALQVSTRNWQKFLGLCCKFFFSDHSNLSVLLPYGALSCIPKFSLCHINWESAPEPVVETWKQPSSLLFSSMWLFTISLESADYHIVIVRSKLMHLFSHLYKINNTNMTRIFLGWLNEICCLKMSHVKGRFPSGPLRGFSTKL